MNVLTLFEINVSKILALVFKCKSEQAPHSFIELIRSKPKTKYTMRSHNSLHKPKTTKKYMQYTFSFRGPHLWKSIIVPIKNLNYANSLPSFQQQVKRYLLAKIIDIMPFF